MRELARSIAVAVAVVLVFATGAMAGGNNLQVTSPGLNGTNFKLDANIVAGQSNQIWVQDNTPTCESTYNVEWYSATPTVAPGDFDTDDNLSVMLIRSEAPAGNAVRCLMRAQPCGTPPCNPQVRCSVRWNDNKIRFIGQSAFNPNFEHVFRFELVRDTDLGGPGTANGIARFFRDGNQAFSRSDIDNDDTVSVSTCWDSARMGIGQPVPGNTVGIAETLSFDEFVSTR
jgi:hypothetical protein